MIKRDTPPGQRSKKRRASFSEYGKELKEKQKLKFWYGLRERQFKKYVKEVLSKRKKGEDINLLLVKKLESRLDNVVFGLGLSASKKQARKLITQKHFLINGKNCNSPSFEVKTGDTISIKPNSLKKTFFQNLKLNLKKYQPSAWLELNREKLEGKVLRQPTLEEINIPAEIPMILEFYSR